MTTPVTFGFLLYLALYQVRLGHHQLTHEKVALKFLPKSSIVASMGAAERATTEIQCLMALNHPNVIRLVQVRWWKW